jgi:hypothetical protein
VFKVMYSRTNQQLIYICSHLEPDTAIPYEDDDAFPFLAVATELELETAGPVADYETAELIAVAPFAPTALLFELALAAPIRVYDYD